MGGIHRPSQGIWYPQSCITHRHTRKIWRTPKNMSNNKMHVQKKHSQAHHWKDWYIHQLQRGCQTTIHHDPITISVLNDGLCQNTRRRVDGPATKQIPIFTQIQLTKINRTITEPQTRQLLVWHYIQYILHALCRRADTKRGINLLSNQFSWFGLEIHIGIESPP